jgi:8-oxo-dGTP pyrophosphatase MutT (NUDIX family)
MHPPKPRRQKVVAYITHNDRLLVFRHSDFPYEEVGLQVPAGTVKPNEDPATAVLREATEETDLHTLRVVRELGTADYDMTPYRREIHERHFFHLTVDGTVPERWESAERDHGDPIRFECFWIPLADGHVLSGGQGALLATLFD